MRMMDLTEDSIEYILYVNGKAAAKYRSESDAFNDMNHLKRLGHKVKLMKQVCDMVPLDEDSVAELEKYKFHSLDKLDNILLELCKMVIEGQKKNPELFGMVAACVVDMNNNKVCRINVPAEDGKRIHAERAAIDAYREEYGDIEEGSIIITTLSPCSDDMNERYGESCSDLIAENNIHKVYCGYIDPTQSNTDGFDFAVKETENKSIRNLCKKFADTFLGRIDESISDSTSTNDLLGMLKEFLPIAVETLKLKSLPKIKPVLKLEGGGHPSFGRYLNELDTIELVVTDRHPIDILRTLAHELVHHKQREDDRLKHDSGETGSDEENEANAVAGIIMRNYDDANPEAFDETPVEINELDDKVKPKSWDDYGQPPAPTQKKPEEKVYKSWQHYDDAAHAKDEKQKQVSEGTDYAKGNIDYHSTLNPIAWQNDSLRKEVRTKLLEIAKVFIDYLDIPEFEIQDIVLTGSMANYNYTEQSDFDLHVITDYADLKCEDLAEKLYQAKKHIWNDAHDITIYGHDVEMYVEDINSPPVSSGVYSVLSNNWIKKPKNNPQEIDDVAVNTKVRNLIDQIYRALADANDPSDIRRLIEKLRKMRRSSLDIGGEFSVENLAYKILRNEGYIQYIYDTLVSMTDQQLSLDEGFTPMEIAIMEGGHSLE